MWLDGGSLIEGRDSPSPISEIFREARIRLADRLLKLQGLELAGPSVVAPDHQRVARGKLLPGLFPGGEGRRWHGRLARRGGVGRAAHRKSRDAEGKRIGKHAIQKNPPAASEGPEGRA